MEGQDDDAENEIQDKDGYATKHYTVYSLIPELYIYLHRLP